MRPGTCKSRAVGRMGGRSFVGNKAATLARLDMENLIFLVVGALIVLAILGVVWLHFGR